VDVASFRRVQTFKIYIALSKIPIADAIKGYEVAAKMMDCSTDRDQIDVLSIFLSSAQNIAVYSGRAPMKDGSEGKELGHLRAEPGNTKDAGIFCNSQSAKLQSVK
jgi:hypothetical protein